MKEEKTSIPEEEGTQSEAKEETEKTEQTEDKTKAQQRKLLEELKKQNSWLQKMAIQKTPDQVSNESFPQPL